MFNPKAPSWTPTGKGFEALRPEDVAHALSGLERPAYLLALIKWAGDETPNLREELARDLLLASASIAARANWHIPRGPGYLRGLVATAIWEMLDNRKCEYCEGRGIVYPPRSAAVDCNRCGGTGKQEASERMRAEISGIPRAAWRRVWFRRYWRVFGVLAGWEDAVKEHLRARLAHDEPAKPLAA
jgi:hypothetical protein